MYQGLDGNWYDDNGNQVPDPSTSGGGPPPSTAEPGAGGSWGDGSHFYDHPGEPAPITAADVKGLYARFYPGHNPTDAEIQSHLGHPGGLQALSKFFEEQSKGYVPPAAGGTGGTPPPGAPPPSSDFQAPPPSWDFSGWSGGAPGFNPPAYQKPPAFTDPDYADVVGKDPGYLFERNAGIGALEHSAAAKGTLNGGGTLMDVNAWGQKFAATRVNDARNRAKDTYLTNYTTQYSDPYKYQYQAALDQFLGRNSQWQTQGQVGQRQNESDWLHAYTPWNDTWNRRVQVDLS